MQDKFYKNFLIVLPAALLALGIYVIMGREQPSYEMAESLRWAHALPYLVVLALAVCGVDVLVALFAGILSSGAVVWHDGGDFALWVESLGKGMQGMGELIIVTLLAGGLLGLIRHFGGISYVVRLLSEKMKGRRSAELGIALMVVVANCCTANNTVAILTVGDIARHVSQRFGIAPARAASLLDTFSCVVQGALPYGAQLLMASQLSGISTSEIIPCLYYPMLLGAVALGFIALRRV